MSATIRIPAMLASFAASLTVTLLNGGHGGLTVLAVMLLIPGLMLAVGGVIDERDAAVAAMRRERAEAKVTALNAQMEIEECQRRVRAWRDLSNLDVSRVRSAEETIRTLATEHAKSIRPETSLNVSRRWLNRRTYMAPDVAAIYAARVAKGGK